MNDTDDPNWDGCNTSDGHSWRCLGESSDGMATFYECRNCGAEVEE